MKLLLQRSQKAGMLGMGSIIFGLDVRAQLTESETENIKKYKMGHLVLYEKAKVDVGGIGDAVSAGAMSVTGGLGRMLAGKMLNLTIKVDDLVKGKHIECKDIMEMRAAEEQIKQACGLLKEVLETAAQFGGEEVLEF